jgi:hypothetical protein
MNTTSSDGYLIINSRLNNMEEQFEVVESMAFFENKSFAQQIKDSLVYYEISFEGLAESINITNFRLGALLNENAEFTPEEIKLIRNRLHF